MKKTKYRQFIFSMLALFVVYLIQNTTKVAPELQFDVSWSIAMGFMVFLGVLWELDDVKRRKS